MGIKRIKDLPVVSTPVADDKFLLDSLTDGSRCITMQDFLESSGARFFVQPGAPATTYPNGSVWLDSDSANSRVNQLVGAVWTDTGLDLKGPAGAISNLASGLVNAPALAWQSETTSGWYRIAAGRFGYSFSGVLKYEMNATDFLLPGNPTVALGAATKQYVDGIVAAVDAYVNKGVIDCSANPNYPAADSGWTYRVSVAGKIGGASGINVEAGDLLMCNVDSTASGNQATVGANWSIVQANVAFTAAGIAMAIAASATAQTALLDAGTSSVKGILQLATASEVKTGTDTAKAVTAAGIAGAQIFPGLPQNSKSAAYTTVLADANKHLYHPSADTTARIWTIDSNANVPYDIGTTLTFVNDSSAGVITIAITTDTLVLAGAGTTGSRTLAANGQATAIKVTATRWQISGVGLT